MADPTPRQQQILATLLQQDWLRGNPALVKATTPAAVMALELGEELSLDSLDVIAAVVEIEDVFDFEAEDADHDGLKTILDVVALVERKTAHG